MTKTGPWFTYGFVARWEDSVASHSVGGRITALLHVPLEAGERRLYHGDEQMQSKLLNGKHACDTFRDCDQEDGE